jgi:hypothetical protein
MIFFVRSFVFSPSNYEHHEGRTPIWRAHAWGPAYTTAGTNEGMPELNVAAAAGVSG